MLKLFPGVYFRAEGVFHLSDISVTAGPISCLAGAIDSIADKGFGDQVFIQACEPALRRLISKKGFLPNTARQPSEKGYARHLLYSDPKGRYCVAAMVWTPGQGTPIHDHDGSWGMIGMVQGRLEVVNFHSDGKKLDVGEVRLRKEAPHAPRAGSEDCVCGCADIHAVKNRFSETAISIHIYARDIKKCLVFEEIPGGKNRYMAKNKMMAYSRDSSI